MIFRFKDLAIDEGAREVRRGTARIDVEPKVLDLTLLLIRHRERLVTKTELLDTLWGGRALSESVMARAVHEARKLLGDATAIRTYYGRGYRFVAPDTENATTPTSHEPGGASEPSPTPLAPTRRPLVGRGTELRFASACIDAVIEGHPRILTVAGEAGIGKTTLCDRIAELAAERGAHVAWGRCSELPGMPAYWPFVQVLRKLLEPLGPARRDALLDAHPGVRELVTALAFGGPALAGDPEQSRFRFFDSVMRFIRALAETRPLALVFDDLHRADTPSFLLFSFLAEQLVDVRVFLVAAYRAAELSSHPARARLLSELGRRGARLVELAGLTAPDVSTFVESATGAPPSSSVLEHLVEQTAGNPFYLSLLVDAGSLDGRRKRVEHTRDMALPASVSVAIEGHLTALPFETRRALEAAAVIGRDFELRLLAAVLGLEREAVVGVLEAAIDARLVVTLDSELKAFRFVHVLVRDVLYAGPSSLARSDLHRAVGTSLERFNGPDDAFASELAYHFSQATGAADAEKAGIYAMTAAELALKRLAYEDATQKFEAALAAFSEIPGQDDRFTCDLLLKLAVAQTRAGDLPSARKFFHQAAELARRAHAPERLAQVALELAPGFFSIETGILDDYMVERLEESLTALGPDDSLLRLRLLARLAVALYWSKNVERRTALSAEADALAARLGTPEARLHALGARHAALWSPANLVDRLEWSKELVDLATKVDDPSAHLVHSTFPISDLLENGEMDAMRREVARFRELAHETRQPECIWMSDTYEHMLAFMRGEFARVSEFGMRSIELGNRLRHHNAGQTGGCHLLLALGETAGVGNLIPSLDEFVKNYPGAPWAAAYVMACMRAGEDARARAALVEMVASLSSYDTNLSWLSAMSVLTETAAHLDAAPEGAVLYDALNALPRRRSIIVGYGITTVGSIERYLGLAALAAGRLDLAVGHFELAIDENQRMELQPYVAHARRELAVALGRRGRAADGARRQGLLEESRRTADALGMTWLATQLEQNATA